MVQVIEEAPGFATGLGQGLARSLSEQLPREIGRHRLSQGLKSLEERAPGMTPFQQVAELYGIPGATPEMVSAFLPLLQQQQANVEARQALGKRPAMAVSQEGQAATGAAPTFDLVEELSGNQPLMPLSQRENTSSYLVPASAQQIDEAAVRLQQQQPNRFRDIDKAREEVRQLDTRRLQEEQAFEARKSQTQEKFNEFMQRKLQKDGAETFSDILGELQDDFITKAQNDVAKGILTPDQAAKKYGGEALDFAKQRQILTSQKFWQPFRHPFSGKENRKKLETIKKQYDKYGMGEAFKNDLIAFQGLTSPYANFLAIPLSQKEKQFIGDLPGGSKFLFAKGPSKEKIDNLAKGLVKNLSPEDSLQSIGIALKSKGYNDRSIMEALRTMANEDKIKLSERQMRELSEPLVKPSLADIYFYGMIGLDKLLGE